jgi:hypothetical protein
VAEINERSVYRAVYESMFEAVRETKLGETIKKLIPESISLTHVRVTLLVTKCLEVIL